MIRKMGLCNDDECCAWSKTRIFVMNGTLTFFLCLLWGSAAINAASRTMMIGFRPEMEKSSVLVFKQALLPYISVVVR